MVLFSEIRIFIQSKDIETDYQDFLTKNVNFLDENFCINENSFKFIPSESLIILDDFSFATINSKEKLNFLKIVNYSLRHLKITLIIVIHNLYNIGLYQNILLAPHLFIAYSNLGSFILR